MAQLGNVQRWSRGVHAHMYWIRDPQKEDYDQKMEIFEDYSKMKQDIGHIFGAF